MDNQGIVDITEECNLLLSLQLKQVNSLQLGSCSNILFKFSTGTDTLVVNSLVVVGGEVKTGRTKRGEV